MIRWPHFPFHTDPLRHWRDVAPDRVALIDRARKTRQTYRELDAACDRWAALLRERNIGLGDRVAIVAGNRHEVAELFFACIRVGAALVPLNWRLAPRELGAIVSHSMSALLVGEARFRDSTTLEDMPPWLDLDIPDRGGAEASDTPPLDVETDPDTAALILYTSGSTGHPKGVIIPHRQILYNAISTTTAWELGHTDIAPVSTPFFHTGGWNVFATPLWYRGGTVVLFDQFDPATFLDGLAEEGCTVALTVPTQLVMMLGSSNWGRPLPDLRFFISGGAPCPSAVMAKVRGAGYNLREGYGLTECGPNCFAISTEESLANPGKVGRPVPFLEMRLMTNATELATVGQPGELQLRGPQMFGGYLHDAERTTEALTDDGWLHTGDLATRDANGLYSICGRTKEMYISGGENVFPAEVESAIASHPSVSECVVVGMPHDLWGEVGCAFVILHDGAPALSGEELIRFVREHVASYKAPRTVVFTRELPRLGSGKPDRRALAKAAAERVLADSMAG